LQADHPGADDGMLRSEDSTIRLRTALAAVPFLPAP